MSKRPDDVRGETMGRFLAHTQDNPTDVLVDASRGVLLDGMEVSAVKGMSGINKQQRGGPQEHEFIAMVLEGRVNRSRERAKVLWLIDVDGAAAIISELLAIATRMGPEFAALLMARMKSLEDEGHMGPQPSPQPVDESELEHLVETDPHA